MVLPATTTAAAATVLDYSNAYWGDDKCPEIVEAARRVATPLQLDLRGNRFAGAGAKLLAELLKSPEHRVISLCLEWNNVGLLDEGVVALAGALEVDTRLAELDLRNNNIGPDGARALAHALRRNRSLRRLDLRWNEIGNAGVLAFLDALQDNHSLLALELTGNNSSLKHAEEIERLLARNRSIQHAHPRHKQQLPTNISDDQEDEPAGASNKKAADDAGHDDQLLLQVLAEKDSLEADLGVAKRQISKLHEKIEECELQIQLARKECEVVKDDRDRYQQRERDVKAEAHELRMRLEELENRRKMEFEEYRMSRVALERECNVLREKMEHAEALHQKSDDQKTKVITQLEELRYKLESEVHRLTMSTGSQQEEYQRLKKELFDAQQESERKEQKLRASHESELSHASRQYDQTIRALENQLAYSSEQLTEVKQQNQGLRDKHDNLQAALLQAKVLHEKEVHELKKHWEVEMQDRLQRSVMAIEMQVEDVKKGRLHLEKEVEKHMDTIVRLRQENISLQQAHDERMGGLQKELERQYLELQEQRDQVGSAQKEVAKADEKIQQYIRRIDEYERSAARIKGTYEDRLKEMTKSAEVAAVEFKSLIKDRGDQIARLERENLILEQSLSRLHHAHEQRVTLLAESITTFIQGQMAKERERWKRLPENSRGRDDPSPPPAPPDNVITDDREADGGMEVAAVMPILLG